MFAVIPLTETSNIFHIFIFSAAALPLMPYRFLTCQTYISQTCPQRRSARELHWHTLTSLATCTEAVAVSCHWSAGRGRGVASAAATLHYLWQGSRGERWERPSRHYKETELGRALPAELSLIGQTFNLVYVCCEGVGSPQTGAERPLSLWVVFNNRNFFLEFYHVGKEFGTAVSHPLNKGMVEETVFYDKRFSFLDADVREARCDLTSLSSDRRDTGDCSHLNKYFLVSLRSHYKSVLEHLHHWA